MLWNFTVYNPSEFLSHRLSGLQKYILSYVLCTYVLTFVHTFKEEVISLFIRQITIFCSFTLSSSLEERWGSWKKGRIERLETAVGLPTSAAAAAAFAKSFMALAKAAAIAAFFLAFTVNDVQQREARIFVRRFERAATCLKTVLRQLIATTERNSVKRRKQDNLVFCFQYEEVCNFLVS